MLREIKQIEDYFDYGHYFDQGRRYTGVTWGQAPLVKKKKKKLSKFLSEIEGHPW
jgi:hypothetical protein